MKKVPFTTLSFQVLSLFSLLLPACSLRSTPSISDGSQNTKGVTPKPNIAVFEERIEPVGDKSILARILPAEYVSAEPKGFYHKLRRGQTLYSLSRIYQVRVDRLMRANRIGDPTRLQPGTLIFIPDSSGAVGPETTLSWPLRGRITARFGPRGHEGVDIDGEYGDEVTAAAGGVVIQARMQGRYGRTVVIRHGDGLTTRYAHLSRLRVGIGDGVERGEPIGNVGRSGNASGTHLHFEVRRNGQPVDPMSYLETDTGHQFAASGPNPRPPSRQERRNKENVVQ